MAKLNAPVTDIQLKSNMIITGASNADWASDSKYPSAKAVTDKLGATASGHPVGSVIMTRRELASGETSAVANPAALLGLPGTWVLIDKAFRNTSVTLGKDPSTPTSVAASGLSVASEVIIYNDHSLLLQLELQVNNSSTITVTPGQNPVSLASLSLSRYGVSRLSSQVVSAVAFATSPDLTASSVIRYSINNGGELWLNDILNDGSGTGNTTRKLAGGTRVYINTVIPVPYTDMRDDYCDKFYWQRIA